MSLFGIVEEFDVANGDFDEYIERLEHYFIANEVTDDGKKASILITVVGKDTYSILKSILTPEKPSSKTYAQLKSILTDHLKPKRIVIAERFKFYERKQLPNERIISYVAAIKKLASTCEFGKFFSRSNKGQVSMWDVRLEMSKKAFSRKRSYDEQGD